MWVSKKVGVAHLCHLPLNYYIIHITFTLDLPELYMHVPTLAILVQIIAQKCQKGQESLLTAFWQPLIFYSLVYSPHLDFFKPNFQLGLTVALDAHLSGNSSYPFISLKTCPSHPVIKAGKSDSFRFSIRYWLKQLERNLKLWGALIKVLRIFIALRFELQFQIKISSICQVLN